MRINPQQHTAVTSPYRVDVTRGGHDGRVASQWFSRPADERYLSLDTLYSSVKGRRTMSDEYAANTGTIRVAASAKDPTTIEIYMPDRDMPLTPTHWSFSQLCSLIEAPASYLRKLPAEIAAVNMQTGLMSHRAELIKVLETNRGHHELRGVTGLDYGRIWDHELVEAVMRIAGNGTGDTIWKVPGVLDWSTVSHNPFVDITKDTTTLYASDRDVFIFLVDDAHPIEAGRLPNGEPDLYFRGFYCWNSEVGKCTLGVALFYLRAVCMNRNLWGVEGFQEIKIRHSKYAADRFVQLLEPALNRFATSRSSDFIEQVNAARLRRVAADDDEREGFLRSRGFSRSETQQIIQNVFAEEERPPETIFDFVQGLTAYARGKPHQDSRLELEGKARELLKQAA